MHASKLPLTIWFWAAYLMATHSNGISALCRRRHNADYADLRIMPTTAWNVASRVGIAAMGAA
jgi:hypothetical protein